VTRTCQVGQACPQSRAAHSQQDSRNGSFLRDGALCRPRLGTSLLCHQDDGATRGPFIARHASMARHPRALRVTGSISQLGTSAADRLAPDCFRPNPHPSSENYGLASLSADNSRLADELSKSAPIRSIRSPNPLTAPPAARNALAPTHHRPQSSGHLVSWRHIVATPRHQRWQK